MLIKRITDIIISLLFLCTVFPFASLFVFTGNILTNSKGPLFFRQKRTGLNGNTFVIYKYRSMNKNADADILQASRNDPRKTYFGKFLRFTSIDELPQFINVLKGDMSIIGPRPHMLSHTEYYSARISNYMDRHAVRPGITGWAQVHGFRGETRQLIDMENRVNCDIWYIKNWSLMLDVKIFFMTVWQVIFDINENAF